GRKGPLARRHLAFEPSDGLVRTLGKQSITAALPGKCQKFKQLGVVVQHLFEVRDQPALVDGVAGEAAAKMIVNAAFAHTRETVLDCFEKAYVVGPQTGAPEHFQDGRLRKFRSTTQAAIDL